MHSLRSLLVVVALSLLFSCTAEQQIVMQKPVEDPPQIAPDQELPFDPKIRKGTLENGLTYYIRQNDRPENRIELRLAVNAGSILEDEDQQGLAHFCEHMAFNGTKNFEKHELVDYLESIGMRFGPEINAYTSFDETVYMLELPADSAEVLEQGFQVLEDWAHQVSYEAEEIEKERGVVIEEWRLGRGAGARMRDEMFPVLFKGSRYAERLPIGKKAVLDTFHHETARRFYNNWYRPELMAVIAVGDLEEDRIEELIRSYFADVPENEDAPERTYYEVPGHEETLYSVTADSEATNSTVSIYHKFPVEKETHVADYRAGILENIYNGMFNNRLNELSQQEDPPFVYGYSAKGQFVRTSEFYMLAAMVKDNGIERGLDVLLTEAERVKQHGFTQSELDRQKQAVLRQMEQVFDERDKIESASLAAEYIRNYLNDEPLPGIEYEYAMYKQFVPGITLEEVNALAQEWIQSESRVVTVQSPLKDGVTIPDEEALKTVVASVGDKTIIPYEDDVVDAPLVADVPEPRPVSEEVYHEELDVTEWKLPNGVRVILKPTDFKNDEIRFTATSPGGLSLVPTDELIPGRTATSVITESGVGAFSQIQLQKLLSDKVVRVSPYISRLTEGFSGQVSPKDMETLFQLVYLYFTSPRKDSTAFASFQSRMQAFYENRSARPETAWSDTITVTLTQYHPRHKPITAKSLEKMDLQTSFEIFSERFEDAGDFMFFFVGNFENKQIRYFVETYLANLPSTAREESWKDKTYEYPEGVIKKLVKKGKEPKSQNSIIFTGPFEWSRENRYIANALLEVLRIKLRERIREDLGGTYGVRVSGQFPRYPKERYKISIQFGTDPDRIEELTSEIFSQIDSLVQYGITETYLNKVKAADMRTYEKNLKENGFWLSNLEFKYFHGEDPMDILTYPTMVDNLTLKDIQTAAQKYLNMDNYIRVVLVPEDWEKEEL